MGNSLRETPKSPLSFLNIMGTPFEMDVNPIDSDKANRVVRYSSAKMIKLHKNVAGLRKKNKSRQDVDALIRAIKKGSGCDPNSFFWISSRLFMDPKEHNLPQFNTPWMHRLARAGPDDFPDEAHWKEDSVRIMEKMIKEGGNVSLYWFQNVPFCVAVLSANFGVAKLLYENGADKDLNTTVHMDKTPLSHLLELMEDEKKELSDTWELYGLLDEAEEMRKWLVEKGAKETHELSDEERSKYKPASYDYPPRVPYKV